MRSAMYALDFDSCTQFSAKVMVTIFRHGICVDIVFQPRSFIAGRPLWYVVLMHCLRTGSGVGEEALELWLQRGANPEVLIEVMETIHRYASGDEIEGPRILGVRDVRDSEDVQTRFDDINSGAASLQRVTAATTFYSTSYSLRDVIRLSSPHNAPALLDPIGRAEKTRMSAEDYNSLAIHL
jgi:hypothetical protein